MASCEYCKIDGCPATEPHPDRAGLWWLIPLPGSAEYAEMEQQGWIGHGKSVKHG